jgi:hypothetical protein
MCCWQEPQPSTDSWKRPPTSSRRMPPSCRRCPLRGLLRVTISLGGTPAAGPLCGLQRSKRSRTSGLGPHSGRAEARLSRAEPSHVWTALRWQGLRACCEARRCCHVSGLLTRRTCAAGPNAFRGTDPDQKHAFEDALARLGCSVPGTDRLFALPSVRPSQPRLVAVVRCYAAWPTGSLYRSPVVMIAQMMRAVLLASATAATLVERRASNCTSHGRWVPCRCA